MPEALQLCPNDAPPFADVCAGHAAALTLLGYRVTTAFFERRAGAPAANARYLPPRRVLDGAAPPALILTHRYRAYRAAAGPARRFGIPHMAVAHEFGMFASARRRLRRRLLHRACRFAAVSPPVAEELRRAGVPAPALLPNPIDQTALRAALLPRAAARASLDLPNDAFVVGVVGRLHPKKAPQRALRAFQAHRASNPAARLAFLGDGELRPRLEREAGDGVTFAGFRADAKTLLAAFDLLLCCSTSREAFGLALLEAAAAGVPVVAAAQPGPRFALGDEGVYFDTDEELIAALRRLATRKDPERRAPSARIERVFSVAALAERYRQLL